MPVIVAGSRGYWQPVAILTDTVISQRGREWTRWGRHKVIFLADSTVALMLQCCVRLSVVVCLWRYVLWLNGAS